MINKVKGDYNLIINSLDPQNHSLCRKLNTLRDTSGYSTTIKYRYNIINQQDYHWNSRSIIPPTRLASESFETVPLYEIYITTFSTLYISSKLVFFKPLNIRYKLFIVLQNNSTFTLHIFYYIILGKKHN